MTPRATSGRGGFSLLEAIVALAITSLVLTLVFSIGMRATEAGFSVGRRALAVSDTQLDEQTVRAVLRGLSVPPRGGATPQPDLDGGPAQLTAAASFSRPTACAGMGPAGPVRLVVSDRDGQGQLSCQAGRRAASLMGLGRGPAAFSYSRDGRQWSDQIHLAGAVEKLPAGMSRQPAREQRLWVRLATNDRRIEIVEAISSGPAASNAGGTPQ